MEYFDREFYSKIQEASFSLGVYWICKRFIDLTEGLKKKKDDGNDICDDDSYELSAEYLAFIRHYIEKNKLNIPEPDMSKAKFGKQATVVVANEHSKLIYDRVWSGAEKEIAEIEKKRSEFRVVSEQEIGDFYFSEVATAFKAPALYKTPASLFKLVRTILIRMLLPWLSMIFLVVAWYREQWKIAIVSLLVLFVIWILNALRFESRRVRLILLCHLYSICFSPVLIYLYAKLYEANGIIESGVDKIYSFKDCLYFSIVTWTTLGYGDLAPTSEMRLWAASEAVVGYAFTALIISLFILLLGQKRKNHHYGPARRLWSY